MKIKCRCGNIFEVRSVGINTRCELCPTEFIYNTEMKLYDQKHIIFTDAEIVEDKKIENIEFDEEKGDAWNLRHLWGGVNDLIDYINNIEGSK